MSVHLYLNPELTERISEGDMTNPDADTFDGGLGESKDRQIFIANEQATLASAVTEDATELSISAPMSHDGDYIIIESEIVKVISGGGTTALTVERGVCATTRSAHPESTMLYSAVRCTDLVVSPIDDSGTDETTWCALAMTQEGLDLTVPGEQLIIGDKEYNQTISFWRRITVPPGTPLQNNTDLKFRVTGTETLITIQE